MESPFHIFPEEIWQVILEHCENSSDVLKAFPQLLILFRGKEFSWRIGDILASLFPKLISFKDIKNCRLVSKRWKNGVDKFIESSNPDLLPYGTAAASGNHFNYKSWRHITACISPCFQYDDEPDDICTFKYCYKSEYSSTQAHVFFPGRAVFIIFPTPSCIQNGRSMVPCQCCRPLLTSDYGRRRQVEVPTWETKFSLKSAGHQIWHVTFDLPRIERWPDPVLPVQVIQCLFRCLSYLPNLKSLKLDAFEMDVSKNVCRNIISFLREPSIPARVESLDLSYVARKGIYTEKLFNSFLTLFVNHNQVKKLIIFADQWTNKLPNMLPNLIELRLDGYHFDLRPTSVSVKSVLHGLIHFPCLRKLCVVLSGIGVAKIIQLVSALQIESLELHEEFEKTPLEKKKVGKSVMSKISKTLRREKVTKPVNSFAPSIRHLKINAVENMNFKFLSMLPSLEFLYVKRNVFHDIFSQQQDTSDIMLYWLGIICSNSSMTKLDIMRQMSFPHLRIISVETRDGLKQCVREDPTKIYLSRSWIHD